MILTGLIVAALASLAHEASAENGLDNHGPKYDLLDLPSASKYLPTYYDMSHFC